MLKKAIKNSLRVMDYVLWTDFYVKAHNRWIGFHDTSYRFEKGEVAFIHIPKTGGTSLHRLMQKDHELRFVGLNMHRPISRFCDPTEYSYVTVMREPIERVWSYYQMVRRRPVGHPYKRFAEKGLEAFLDHCWEVRNMACRYYSGRIAREPNADAVDVALCNLANFAFVLDFSDFSNQVILLLEKYDIPVARIPHERKSSYARPSDREIGLIARYNALDVTLFEEWRSSRAYVRQ